MLLERFKDWRNDPDNNSMFGNEDSAENFSIFYQQYAVGCGWFEMLADLAFQIYELQIAVEGLIEDMES